MSNTRLWDKLGKTDPANTKGFKRAGGFSGTAIKPMWSFKRMTEEFGPCGIGWGVNEPSFQVVPGENKEVLVYCTVSVWYSEEADSEEGGKYRRLNQPVFGVGGDKVVTHIKANEQYNRPERWESDDEAFKKAYTDAIGNALKLIGVGADVHMGLFDDSKYVNEMRQEFSEDTPPKPSARPVETQEQSSLSQEEQQKIAQIAANIDFALEQSGPNLAKVWKENWSTIQALPKHLEDALTQKKDKLKANMLPK